MILALSISILLFVAAILAEVHATLLLLGAILMFSITSFIWEHMKARVEKLEKKVEALMDPFKEDK